MTFNNAKHTTGLYIEVYRMGDIVKKILSLSRFISRMSKSESHASPKLDSPSQQGTGLCDVRPLERIHGNLYQDETLVGSEPDG